MDGFNFALLPPEIQFEILFNTDPSTIINLCNTSPQYSSICGEEYDYLWKSFIYTLMDPIYEYEGVQEFNETNNTNFDSWFGLYMYVRDLPINDDIFIDEVRNGSVEIVKYLVDNGIHIDVYNNQALKISSQNGYLELVEYLIENGANRNDALRYSSEKGHLNIVRYAITHGANIHVYGDLPLLLASKNGHLNVVKYLVKHGADIRTLNNLALTYASNNGHQDIVKYLKRKLSYI